MLHEWNEIRNNPNVFPRGPCSPLAFKFKVDLTSTRADFMTKQVTEESVKSSSKHLFFVGSPPINSGPIIFLFNSFSTIKFSKANQ